MSAKTLLAVAFKVIGIYILMGIAVQFPFLLRAQPDDAVFVYLGWGIPAILAVSLVLFGTALGRLLIGDSAEIQLSLTAVELRRVGFAIVGLMTLLSGIRNAAAVVQFLVERHEQWNESAWAYLWMFNPDLLVNALFGIAVGPLLLINHEHWLAARDWVVRNVFYSKRPGEQ